MATMAVSDTLRQRADRVWRRIITHPFVRGLGDGSLPLDRFTFFLRQDYLFLIDYSRVLAIASAKAPDLDGMRHLAGLMHATLTQEMELHQQYCAGFGISLEALERTQVAPGTSAYTRFLLSVAYEGSITEIAAALLPCEWGYAEIGLELARTGDTSERNRYAQWICTYAAQEFQDEAAWLRGYLDGLARNPSKAQRRRLEELFLTSCRYEYLFWEMAYHKQRWPV